MHFPPSDANNEKYDVDKVNEPKRRKNGENNNITREMIVRPLARKTERGTQVDKYACERQQNGSELEQLTPTLYFNIIQRRYTVQHQTNHALLINPFFICLH